MALTTEEKTEVILMSGERNFRVIAADFNNRHPEKLPISHNNVRCLISKFRETGTVVDKARSGRPKSATDETHSLLILQPFRHFTYVTTQFSNPYVALPTSQLILQPFRCFTYVTVHSPTLLSLLLRHLIHLASGP